VHAVDDCAHRHGKEFKKIALTVGLVGKMREASAGPQLRFRLSEIAVQLVKQWGPPKAACPACGFRVSMLMKYLGHNLQPKTSRKGKKSCRVSIVPI